MNRKRFTNWRWWMRSFTNKHNKKYYIIFLGSFLCLIGGYSGLIDVIVSSFSKALISFFDVLLVASLKILSGVLPLFFLYKILNSILGIGKRK